jgi:transposase-like protein
MEIKVIEDYNRNNDEVGEDMATCPACGQKLFKVYSVRGSGLLRIKCRRCRRWWNVHIRE